MNSVSGNPRSESSDTPALKSEDYASDATLVCESRRNTSTASLNTAFNNVTMTGASNTGDARGSVAGSCEKNFVAV